MELKKLKSILGKKNLEEYIFDDDPLVAYFATAFAGDDLFYKLIDTGSIRQKINVIEHGSSRHVHILVNSYDPLIKDRAMKRAYDLKTNIFHEFVTAQKIELLFSPYVADEQLEFFPRETNPLVKELYLNAESIGELYFLVNDENFIKKIMKSIEISNDELKRIVEDKELKRIVEDNVNISKEFLSKYGFTLKFGNSYQLGYITALKDEDEIFTLMVNGNYYNKDNPKSLIYARDTILHICKYALEAHSIGLNRCDFDSLESYKDYRKKCSYATKLGFSKEELSEILDKYGKYKTYIVFEDKLYI